MSLRDTLIEFTRGTAGERIDIPAGGRRFALSYHDAGLERALADNARSGWFDLVHGAEVFRDRVVQHEVVRRLDPDLALACWTEPTGRALTPPSGEILVARPRAAAGRRGAAVYFGLGPENDREARSLLARQSGDVLVHRFVPGSAIFVNAIMCAGTLAITDVWSIISKRSGCRDILASVVGLPTSALPAELAPRLQRLSTGLGIQNGPMHFELVLADSGPKLIKCVPRIATEPLPDLCDLAGFSGQVDALVSALETGFRTIDRPPSAPSAYVADFSFIVRKDGRFQKLKSKQAIIDLPSFNHFHYLPNIGEMIVTGTSGYNYAATIFLKHSDSIQIDQDLEYLENLEYEEEVEVSETCSNMKFPKIDFATLGVSRTS